MTEKLLTPLLKPDGTTMICRKCLATLGLNHDNVYLQFGTVKFYDRAKFFCGFCGKNYVWYERAPDPDPIPEASYSILNALAFD
jgi:hypothetical protein